MCSVVESGYMFRIGKGLVFIVRWFCFSFNFLLLILWEFLFNLIKNFFFLKEY